MNQSRSLVAIVLLPLMILTACTRAKEEVTAISLSIPHSIEVKSKASGKVTSQALTSTQVLGHVIINASGAGIPSPILFTWDSCYDCLNAPPPPTSFVLDIPQGDNRLVQVLAVYMDEASNSMSFYYGDVTAVLNQTAQALTIPVTSLGVSQQIVSGSIAGRYYIAPDMGPTGVVYMKYNPPGKPSMIIEKSHIINGWFNFFTLKGIEFSYEMDNGFKLFGGPVSADSAVFAASSTTPHLLKVTKPIHNRNDSWDSTTANWRQSEPEISILGWFGDPASYAGKIVCRDFTTAPTFTKETTLNSTLTYLMMTAGTPPADLFANSSSVYYQGGTTTGCSDPNGKFISYFSVLTSSYDGKGKDGFAGFRSPLKDTEFGGPFNISMDAAGNRVISGQLLPQISQIQKFTLYKQIGLHVQNYKMDQMNCGAITRGEMPEWVYAGDGNVAADGTFTINSTVSSTDITNMTVGALCFAGPFGYYPYGIGIRTDNWGGYSGSYTQPAATQFVLESPFGSTINQDACVPLRLVAKDANNNPTSNITASVTVNMSGGMGMYSDPSCTSYMGAGYSGSFNFSNYSTEVFYFKSAYANSTYTFSITSTPALPTTIPTLTVQAAATATKMGLFNMDGSPFNSLEKYKCQPTLLMLLDDQNRPAAYIGTNISLTDGASSGTQFFADESTCNMNSAPLSSIGATGGSTKFLVIKNSTSISSSISLSFNEPGLTTQTLNQTVTLQQPGPASYFYISYANMQWNGLQHLIAKGVCLPVQFFLADSYGRMTAPSSATTLTPSSTTGTSFFSDTACTTALSGGVSFAANSPSAGAFMLVSGSIAQSITLSGTLNGAAFSSTYPGMGMSELMPSPVTPTIMSSYLPSAVFQNTCHSLSSIQFSFSGMSLDLYSSSLPVKMRFKDTANNVLTGFTLYNNSACTSPSGGITADAGIILMSNNLYFKYNDTATPYFGVMNVEMSTDQGLTYNVLGQVGRGAQIVPQNSPTNSTCSSWSFMITPYISNGMSTYVPPTYTGGFTLNMSSATNIISCDTTPVMSGSVNFAPSATSSSMINVLLPGTINLSLAGSPDPGMDFRFTNGQITMPYTQ